MSNDVVTIFVPTRGRAEQLKKNMRLLKENTRYPACELIIIADADDPDTLKVCDKEKLDYVVMLQRSYFVTKINFAFSKAGGNYLVCLSDDVEVEPDWLTIAVDCFRNKFSDDVGVLCFGGDDTYKGNLAIHPFVSRKWIDRYQEGKRVLWHDYWHFYGDTEISLLSHYLKRFVYCPESKAIHTLPKDIEKRDEIWFHIHREIFLRDFAIFEERCGTQFPGYGPTEILVPKLKEIPLKAKIVVR